MRVCRADLPFKSSVYYCCLYPREYVFAYSLTILVGLTVLGLSAARSLDLVAFLSFLFFPKVRRAGCLITPSLKLCLRPFLSLHSIYTINIINLNFLSFGPRFFQACCSTSVGLPHGYIDTKIDPYSAWAVLG